MSNERASELLYDTASTLRLLDAELGELAPRRAAESASVPPDTSAVLPAAIAALDTAPTDLSALFLRAMGDVHAMLAGIRGGREQMRAAAAERVSRSKKKLNEVSSTTESAAIGIMDALERAIANVDLLDTDDVLADSARCSAVRSDLREALFTVMGHMQFQDITSQQIMNVQSMLADMEGRVAAIAEYFDSQAGAASTA